MKYQYHKMLFLSGVVATLGVSALHAQSSRVRLEVPFVSQVPNGEWVLPWSEACEEASITMVDAFYQQKRSVKDAQKRMQAMIDWEKKTWNNYQDTDAEETVEMIQKHASFDGSVERNPSVDDIKEQLDDNQPVIALVNMYELYQERNQSDSYHVLVIVGYDDEKQVFIVNDPARQSGTEYSYDRVMNALHDYNPESKEADAVASVIFTAPSEKNLNGSNTIWARVLAFFRRLF